MQKTEQGQTTYYLRSSVLGGEIVAEINSGGGWARGYVYLGSQLLAIQYGAVYYVHSDPVAKSRRLTDSTGIVQSSIELDPYGAETSRITNSALEPHKFTSYERDMDGGDEAMMRRYGSYWSRFSQPDPFDGSYDLSNPQSFNRYSYTENNPVNFTDPSGLFAYGGPPPAPGLDELPIHHGSDDLPRRLPVVTQQNTTRQTAVDEGIAEARNALQQPLCRAIFGGTDPLSLLNTYTSNGLITFASSYPIAQPQGGIRNENFTDANTGVTTSYGAGSGLSLNRTKVELKH